MLFVLLVIAQVTAKEALIIPDECSSLEDGVCFQSCNGGGCDMECFDFQYYSCKQFCTGEYRLAGYRALIV